MKSRARARLFDCVRERRPLPGGLRYLVFDGVEPAVELGAEGLVPMPVPELELAGLVAGVVDELDGAMLLDEDGEAVEFDAPIPDVEEPVVLEGLMLAEVLEGEVLESVLEPVVAGVVPGVVDVELPE